MGAAGLALGLTLTLEGERYISRPRWATCFTFIGALARTVPRAMRSRRTRQGRRPMAARGVQRDGSGGARRCGMIWDTSRWVQAGSRSIRSSSYPGDRATVRRDHLLGIYRVSLPCSRGDAEVYTTRTGLPGVIPGFSEGEGSLAIIDVFFWTPQGERRLGFGIDGSHWRKRLHRFVPHTHGRGAEEVVQAQPDRHWLAR